MKPGYSALASLFAPFSEGKSEPTKAGTALLKTPLPSVYQRWGHNHPAGAERLKTREASVKQ